MQAYKFLFGLVIKLFKEFFPFLPILQINLVKTEQKQKRMKYKT